MKEVQHWADLHRNLCRQAGGKKNNILLRCMDMLIRWDTIHGNAMFGTRRSISGPRPFTRQLETLR